MKAILSYLLLFFSIAVFAQESNFIAKDIAINKYIDGTLLTPKNNDKSILAIIIADSGPTDRNGNQNFQQNNALKQLSEQLSNKGIATFRYDKRIVKHIRNRTVDNTITFDDFISDATSVIDHFKSKNKYSKLYVIGHGQGSLIGMIASKDKVDGFISIAGSGLSIDRVIIDQVSKMDSVLVAPTKRAFETLKKGKTTKDYPIALGSIFSKDVQPFMMSWMQYDPQKIISTLNAPILILNGTKDLLVPVEEAKLLAKASNNASLSIIDNMNHVFFIIEGKELENSKSYNEPFRKVSESLINEITSFIFK
ncbi:alpha/beta hydrolase [uncultured Psychroserpens sp.]|uniref:alpha/beta hydrolase n=1 Tax=uncultured Psychroserpens sp. TaxID=255436 RepID=UPI0026128392|nr:alpha/beta hydrolase [uncultured Psychroserpens sp.]